MHVYLKHTEDFPNSVGRFISFFLIISTRVFYIRSKIFSYIRNLWILLFQMIYFWSFISHIFMLKLSVYENELHLTELGGTSVILSVSRKMSLILRLLIKYMEKINFREKSIFQCFSREMKGRCLRHFYRASQALS